MTTIGHVIGIPPDKRKFTSSALFPDNTRVGPEIEVESCPETRGGSLFYWNIVNDGSLRNNGREFVSKNPIFGEDIVEALREFDHVKEASEAYHGKWDASNRTSVHVHVDVGDLELDQFQRFILLYLSLEKVLFSSTGKRDKNIYCLPYSTAAGMITSVGDFCKDHNLDRIRTEKYISLNTRPIHSQGSVEFRFHEGTFDSNRILTWIRCLLYLKFYAKTAKIDFNNLPQAVSEIGLTDFLSEVFPPEIVEFLSYRGIEKDMLCGIRNAQEALNLENLERVDSEYDSRRSGPNLRVKEPLIYTFARKKGIEIPKKESK